MFCYWFVFLLYLIFLNVFVCIYLAFVGIFSIVNLFIL